MLAIYLNETDEETRTRWSELVGKASQIAQWARSRASSVKASTLRTGRRAKSTLGRTLRKYSEPFNAWSEIVPDRTSRTDATLRLRNKARGRFGRS